MKKASLQKKAKANTRVTKYSDGDEKVKKDGNIRDMKSMHPTPSHGGVIGVALGATLNMGDYESLRADTWLAIPFDGTPEEAQDVYDEVYDAVATALNDVIDEYAPKKRRG